MVVKTTRTRSNTGPFGRLFGSIIMVILGIAFFIASGFMAKQNAAIKERCNYRVDATVVGFDRSDSSDSSATTPLFEYVYNGETYKSKTGTYSSSFKDKFSTGQTYSIFIDPNDPMEIYSEDISKSDATVLTILRWGGVALVILGIVSFALSLIKVIAMAGAAGVALSQFLKKN
jgi:hypothetical protein